jgi:hypothetical protein
MVPSRISVEQFAQAFDSAAEQSRHGRLTPPQLHRDVGHCPLLKMVQFNDGSLVLWQLGQRRGQAEEVFLPHGPLAG